MPIVIVLLVAAAVFGRRGRSFMWIRRGRGTLGDGVRGCGGVRHRGGGWGDVPAGEPAAAGRHGKASALAGQNLGSLERLAAIASSVTLGFAR